MDVKVELINSENHEEQKQPLLHKMLVPKAERNLIQRANSQTLKSTAHLGNICYFFATFKGLWIIDGSTTLPPETESKYRLRFIDFMHAVMPILVFAAIALLDKNVVDCLFPSPSNVTQEILTALPVGISVFCSMLFVAFLTERHGIGFPLSTN